MKLNRRHFIISGLGLIALTPVIISKSFKNVYYIGGRNNHFIWIDPENKKTNKIDLGFVAHSYLQNQANKDQIIAIEKAGGNWCVVDIKQGKIIHQVTDNNKLYYGHFSFTKDSEQIISPFRDFSENKIKIAFIDSKNFSIKRVIASLDVQSIHEIFLRKKDNVMVITAAGYLNNSKRDDGVLFYNLDSDKIENFVVINEQYLMPTHFAVVNDDEFFIAYDDISIVSKFYFREPTPEGYAGKIIYYKNGISSILKLPNQLQSEIHGNNANLQFNSKENVLYVSNGETGNLYTFKYPSLEFAKNYKVNTKGIRLYKDQLYVSCDDNSNGIFKNIKTEKAFKNTHFSIVEI